MADRVRAVAFDVNETLFSLDAVASRLVEVGLGTGSLGLWFARILRDGFAAAAAGGFAAFPDLARHHLRELARSKGVELPEDAADRVIGGFQEVEAHGDVEPAFRRLAAADVRIVTLTNGTAAITRSFLEREGLDGLVERAFEVAEVGLWKPRPEPYRFVADELGVAAGELALVAAHPWDVHGAQAAGLVAGWVNRPGGRQLPGAAPRSRRRGEVARGGRRRPRGRLTHPSCGMGAHGSSDLLHGQIGSWPRTSPSSVSGVSTS